MTADLKYPAEIPGRDKHSLADIAIYSGSYRSPLAINTIGSSPASVKPHKVID